MAFKHGLRNKFYIGSVTHMVGTTITWTEVTLVESIGNEDTRDEAEIVNRRGDMKLYGVGKRAFSYTVTLTYDPADTATTTLLAAYRAGTMLSIADMDGPIATTGTKGMFFDAIITSAPKPEDLSAYDSIELTFKPSAESTFVPVFTTIP